MKVEVTRSSPGATLPKRATEGSSGYDLRADLEDQLLIASGDRALVATGIALAVPEGWEAQVRPRSGLAVRHGVTVLNAPGTIDSDYRGEVRVILINHGKEAFTVSPGDRIAQLVFARVENVDLIEVENLDATHRGNGGFGSTGKN